MPADETEGRPPVLVTGAAGFVGSHLTRALLRSGRRVIGTDRAGLLPQHVTTGLDRPNVGYIPGDLVAKDFVDALVETASEGEPGQLDVVHTAAVIRFSQLAGSLGEAGPRVDDFLASFAVNAQATWRLCAQLHRAGVLRRFVHVSTRAVFGGRQPSVDPVGESEPVQPSGLYGASKAAAEVGLVALRDQFGVDLRIARITGVYGPYQGPVSWIGQAAEAVLASRPYEVATGGDDAYEITYVKDTVRGLALLLEKESVASTPLHIASGTATTLNEVAAAFERVDPGARVRFGAGHDAGATGRAPLRTEQARNQLGFTAAWGLDAALRDYLAVERTNRYGPEAFEPPATSTMSIENGSQACAL